MTEATKVRIEPLSRALAKEMIAELVALDGAGHGGSGWNDESLLREMPGKWDWSSIAVLRSSRSAVGLLIASQRAARQIHVHELIVAPSARKAGVGRKLIGGLVDKVRAGPISLVTLKVAAENLPAQEFYRKLGFRAFRQDGGLLWLALDRFPK